MRKSWMRCWCLFALVSIAALIGIPPALAGRSFTRWLPGDAALDTAVKDQTSVFLAQGGSTVLAVWSDNRASAVGSESETAWDIYGMRFDATGTPLDTVPFVVAAGPAAQRSPRASWNGTSWLVVFESVDFGGTGYYAASLEAVRVAPDGRVLDPAPIKLYNMTPVGATFAVASDGSGWVVVNQGTSVTGDLVAARISAAGTLLDPGPRSLVPGTYYLRGGLHLAYAGGVFLLAYEESMTGSDPANAIRFDADLDLLGSGPFALAPSPLAALAANGSGFYAVWQEQLPDWSMGVKGRRIATNGQLLDGNGVLVSGTSGPIAYTTTSVTWDGSRWKVTWGASGGTRIARVSAAGQVLDPGGVAVAGPRSGLSASAGNGSVQLAWSEYLTGSSYEVSTAHIDAANTAGGIRALSIGAPAQLRVDIATSGSGFMLVYRSSTSTRQRVLAQPLDAAGNPLGTEPVELDAADSLSYPGFPAVAWNGSVYLATWNNASGIVARRLQPNGVPLDPAPILVMNPGFGPVDVEALGDTFLVVGLRCGYNCQYIFPIAKRVRGSDGVVLDASSIQMGGTYSSTPRVVTLGGRWLLAWQANATHDNCMASTLGTFIDAAGVKLPDFSIHGPYSSCGGNGVFGIGLASSGSVALVAQSQELTSGWETDLLFRLVEPNGTVGPYVNLTPWKDDQYRPRVDWDGAQFVIVFQDQKTGLGGEWSLEPIDARSDLVGMRVSASGAIVDPQGFVVSNSPSGEMYPNVAATGGTALIAGSVMRHDSQLASYRVGYDLFGTGGNAWPVAVAAASPTGGDVALSVDFNAAGSTDPDGTITAYSWEFGDGYSATTANPTHLYTTGGPYVATLTVTDSAGAQSLQQILLLATEPNVPPIAVASSNITSGPMPLDVVFDATGSHDPDGTVGNIEWTFSDGGSYWGSPAYHTFSTQGTHQVTLTVHDGRGGTGTDALTITAGTPTAPAAPTDLLAIAFTSEWINVTWSDASNNEDGFTVERCPGSAAFCSASPSSFAPLAQTATNIDYHGDTGLPWGTTFSYRVRAFNATAPSGWSNISTATTHSAPPVAVIVPSVLGGPAPLTVQLGGSGSYDPDGSIVSWSWVFGDGGSASGPLVSHTFTSAGTFSAILYVTSNDGTQASADVIIAVSEPTKVTYTGEAAGNGTVLRLAKAGGSVQLTWGGSCVPTDSDYGVYEGPIGSFTQHVPVTCTTGGAMVTSIVPAAGSNYYVVVPHNTYYEGRYGLSSSGTEIPAGPTRCYPPATTTGCP